MGMCKPSGGKIEVRDPYKHSLNKEGKPNSRLDYYDEDTGKLLQQRWYGPDGIVVWDRDWDHSNPKGNHKFPHDHPWDWSKIPPRQDFMNDINDNYC